MENETELDPRPLILKRMIWDVFPHEPEIVREVQNQLGLVPDGDEGLEVEHERSDERCTRAMPLQEIIDTLSGIAAEAVGFYMISLVQAQTDEEISVHESFLKAYAKQNTEIISDGTFAIIAHLLDTGVLEYGKAVTG
jgi:hypothetical protein